MELAHGQGLVTAPELPDQHTVVSSLLLRIDVGAGDSRRQAGDEEIGGYDIQVAGPGQVKSGACWPIPRTLRGQQPAAAN